MPGIVGLVRKNLNINAEKIMASMTDSMQRKNRFNKEVYTTDFCSFSKLDLAKKNNARGTVCESTDGRYVCSIYGNILDYGLYENELLDNSLVNKSVGKESEILGLYILHGDKLFKEIKGEYVFLIADKKEKSIIIGNDHLGLMPVYYFNNKEGFFFTSEVKALLGLDVELELNYDAVSDFLLFGYLLGEKTFFENVSLLPPASILRYELNNDSVKLYSYWDLSICVQNIGSEKNDNESLDKLNNAFVSSVNKRMKKSETCIALSGGMDSRVILAVAGSIGDKKPTFTSGIGDCIDKKITKKLSRKVGFDNIYESFDTRRMVSEFRDHAEQVTEITDGMRSSPYNALTIMGGEKFHKHGLDNIIYGHGGELAKLNEAYGLSIDGKSSQIKGKDVPAYMYKRASIEQWREIDIGKFIQDKKLLKSMNKSDFRFNMVFSSLDVELPAEQKVSYYFLNEFVRKYTVLSFGVHRDFVDAQVPFLDIDFIKKLLATKVELRKGRDIHKHIIKNNFKSLLDIPLSQTRVRMQPSIYEKLCINIPYRVFCRLGMFKSDKPETLINNLIDGTEYRLVLTDKISRDRGLFSVPMIEDILEKFASDKSYLNFLSRLYLLEIWFRKYVD